MHLNTPLFARPSFYQTCPKSWKLVYKSPLSVSESVCQSGHTRYAGTSQVPGEKHKKEHSPSTTWSLGPILMILMILMMAHGPGTLRPEAVCFIFNLCQVNE
jgi:hypothetical protein